MRGFFLKSDNTLVGIHLNDSETPGFLNTDGKGGYRHAGIIFYMGIDHLTDIHPVDMVRSEHGDQVETMALDEVDVLIDGVCRSLIPAFPCSLLGRNGKDEVIL